MQLTKHTDFAFRTLIYLVMMQQKLTTIQKITDSFDISKSHAMKIVNKLVHAGWIKAVRGKNGGILLGCDANKISLRAVIELMETTMEPVNCDHPPCLIAGACRLRGVLWQAQQQYLNYLAPLTLADLVDSETSKLING
ncbi:MAG: BadM/Rrf2 family transcriptional regulator [Gammaproteobacteria bacterium]|nr:MAG: BadM/Rrf2 family transcriptional regulator [Gammaproteobacteria bacterium]